MYRGPERGWQTRSHRVGQVVGPGVQAEELRSDLTSNGSYWFLRSKDSMKVVFESHRLGWVSWQMSGEEWVCGGTEMGQASRGYE